jgi:hypothetical protein
LRGVVKVAEGTGIIAPKQRLSALGDVTGDLKSSATPGNKNYE